MKPKVMDCMGYGGREIYIGIDIKGDFYRETQRRLMFGVKLDDSPEFYANVGKTILSQSDIKNNRGEN